MSVDDVFSYTIRTAAALVWLVRLGQLLRQNHADQGRRVMVTASLALILSVIAAGGWASGLHVIGGDIIRTAYTGTTVALLAAGVAVWR